MKRLILAASAALIASPLLAEQSVRPATTPTNANINISPKRLIISPNKPNATVFIFNDGGANGAYQIEITDRVMLPNGQIMPLSEALADPETRPVAEALQSAHASLLITPKRKSLKPGESQVIRVRFAPTAALPAGEYRSHLTITTVPPRDTGYTAAQAAGGDQTGLSFQITSVFAVTIPIIVRVGPADVRGHFISARFISPAQGSKHPHGEVVAEMSRDGKSSVFGDVEINPRGSKDSVGVVRSVGIYPEISQRQIVIPLKRSPKDGEVLHIRFTDDDSAPGREVAAADVTR